MDKSKPKSKLLVVLMSFALVMAFIFAVPVKAFAAAGETAVISKSGIYCTQNGTTWQYVEGRWRSTKNTKGKSTITVDTVKVGKVTAVKSGNSYTVTLNCTSTVSASGYELSISESKSFPKNSTSVKTVTSNKVTFTDMQVGKTYYVKGRYYTMKNGKKVYSSYSTVKTVKVR